MIYDYIKTIRYEEEKIENNGSNYFILFLQNGKCIKINHTTKIIIEQFDGKKTLKEVVDQLKDFNIFLTEEEIISIIDNKLLPTGVFGGDIQNGQEKDNTKLWFHRRLIDGEKFEHLLEKIKFLFIRPFVLFHILLFVVGEIYMLFFGGYVGIFNKWVSQDWILFIIILLFSFAFHELGHATAASFYQCKVGGVGIGLYLFRPVLFTDLSYTWKLSNKKRMVVDFGGIYFQIILMNIFLIIFYFGKSTVWAALLLFSILICLFNLNPFLRLDGYWILSDYLEVNNINKLAFMYLETIKARFLKKSREIKHIPNLSNQARKIIYGYIACYLVITGVVFFVGAYMCVEVLIHPLQIIESINNLFNQIYIKDYQSAGLVFLSLCVRLLSFVYILLLTLKLVKKHIRIKVKHKNN